MAINISVGTYSVLSGAVADLRDHYAETRTSINTEVTASDGLTLPAIEPVRGGILASDRRNPPQTPAYLLVQVAHMSRTASQAGEARESFRLVITAGVRHSTRQASAHGSNEHSGHALAALLTDAAKHILIKHLPRRAGCYGVDIIPGSDRAVRGPKGTYQRELAFKVWWRTRNSWGES